MAKGLSGSPPLATGREDLSSLSAYPYNQGVEPRTISQFTLGGQIPTDRLPSEGVLFVWTSSVEIY